MKVILTIWTLIIAAAAAWGVFASVHYKVRPALTQPPTVTQTGACGEDGICSATEIATHNTRADCWVYLSPINKVYNVTEFVADPRNHEGGDVIVPYCGTNIYKYFIQGARGTSGKSHAHSTEAFNDILQAYYIGPFGN